MSKKFYRGDIFYIRPAAYTGSEQQGGRPGIIVSNDLNNEFSKAVEVVYLTTQDKPPLPTHVSINSAAKKSVALCEQITTVSVDRLGDYIGTATPAELQSVEQALIVSLGMDSGTDVTSLMEAWRTAVLEWDASRKIDNENTAYIRACAERDAYKELVFKYIFKDS